MPAENPDFPESGLIILFFYSWTHCIVGFYFEILEKFPVEMIREMSELKESPCKRRVGSKEDFSWRSVDDQSGMIVPARMEEIMLSRCKQNRHKGLRFERMQ